MSFKRDEQPLWKSFTPEDKNHNPQRILFQFSSIFRLGFLETKSINCFGVDIGLMVMQRIEDATPLKINNMSPEKGLVQ